MHRAAHAVMRSTMGTANEGEPSGTEKDRLPGQDFDKLWRF